MNFPGARLGFSFANGLRIGRATITPAHIFKPPEPEFPNAERFHLPEPQPQYHVGPFEPKSGEVFGARISVPINKNIGIHAECGGLAQRWGCNTGININFGRHF